MSDRPSNWINVNNVRLGQVIQCGKASVEIVWASTLLTRYGVSINGRPEIRMRVWTLDKLLNPAL